MVSKDVDAIVETPTGTPCVAPRRASMRSAFGAARLHMPMGLTPNGKAHLATDTRKNASARTRQPPSDISCRLSSSLQHTH